MAFEPVPQYVPLVILILGHSLESKGGLLIRVARSPVLENHILVPRPAVSTFYFFVSEVLSPAAVYLFQNMK